MSAFHNSNPVNRIYRSVIDDVCSNSREGFLDEGLDEQVLQEFKHTWETKVLSTKAIDSFSDNLNTGPVRGSYVPPVPATSHGVRIPMMSSLQLGPQGLPSNITLPAGLVAGTPSGFVIQPLAGGQIRYLPNAAAVQARPFMTKIVGAAPSSALASMVNKPVAQVDRTAPTDHAGPVYQVDGPAGVSDPEDAADDEDPEDLEEEEEEDFTNSGPVEDGDPLNSDDDLSFEDDTEMFETENVAACQYEKVNRTRNKWKFVFKDGIMNISGKDYVFNRASGAIPLNMFLRRYSQQVGVGRVVRAVRRPVVTPVTLTERAKQKILEYLKQQPTASGIRMSVKQRGCNGLVYSFEYASKKDPYDEEVKLNGAKLFIEPRALMTALGTEIDYIESKLSSGFVFRNPNVKGTCGCGESFNV
ncbi:hypothetical protein M514_06713 [Trichuris suis]|uniref:Core domain-containing protein n=1 Tax=Trichuris suis TaxID=68888 RepID=A0A085NKC7_9BILA|nr:hypothetical protein M514_06713 [Trichuris suis]KHJ41400.1 hypothetical protein D918_08510 [Trichuris suis]